MGHRLQPQLHRERHGVLLGQHLRFGDSAAELFAWAAVIFELPVSSLGGHRDYAQTACPGDVLYSILQSGRLEDEVDAVLALGFPELAYA